MKESMVIANTTKLSEHKGKSELFTKDIGSRFLSDEVNRITEKGNVMSASVRFSEESCSPSILEYRIWDNNLLVLGNAIEALYRFEENISFDSFTGMAFNDFQKNLKMSSIETIRYNHEEDWACDMGLIKEKYGSKEFPDDLYNEIIESFYELYDCVAKKGEVGRSLFYYLNVVLYGIFCNYEERHQITISDEMYTEILLAGIYAPSKFLVILMGLQFIKKENDAIPEEEISSLDLT